MWRPLARIIAPALALAAAVVGPAAAGQVGLTGLNLAGGEFGHVGGAYGTDYLYPSDSDLDIAAGKGFSVVRVPLLWERVQPDLQGPLDPTELGRLRDLVRRAEARRLSVILDLHNYGRYRDRAVGTAEVPVAAFAAVWRALAVAFKGDPAVIFGLMNEPHDMPTETWAAAAQAALDAIRATGATNFALVPGNAYSGAHSWASRGYGTPNAVAMRKVVDPCGNAAFEFHQYLDADSSGVGAVCRAPEAVVRDLAVATRWLRETHTTGFLGEFGAGASPQCLAGLAAMLKHVDENAAVWRGWTYWAAGAWWAPDYVNSVQPIAGKDRPQMAILDRFKGPAAAPPASCRASQEGEGRAANVPKPGSSTAP
jgi:endoglucanase